MLLLRIVFLYTTHGTQNILLTHVLVCWFTVLVLSLNVLVLVLVLVLALTVLLPSLPVFQLKVLSFSTIYEVYFAENE